MKPKLELVIGDKQLSSWSMRAWLSLRHLGLEFTEIGLRLDTPGFASEIARYSPAGRVPVLVHGDLRVWDSLAICEYANELSGGRGWPAEPATRAHARAISAEMHSGFAALREQWPMLAATRGLDVPLDAHGRRDLARIEAIWSDCRSRYGARGPWLFGTFTIADAMYAPVTLRLRTYGARLSPTARDYAASVIGDAHVQVWIGGAEQELAAADRP